MAGDAERSGIPFVLLSGYGSNAISSSREGWGACGKLSSSAEPIEQIATGPGPGPG